MAMTEASNPGAQSSLADSNADYKRGVSYLLGDGVTQNLLSSQEFFHKAAQKGHRDAADILSLLPIKRPPFSPVRASRNPKLIVAGALIPVFLLMASLALLPGWTSSSPLPPASRALKTSTPVSGGIHGHRR